MDNQEPARTTVNVKGVEVPAWEIAKKQASMNDESLGTVVSRALYQMGKTDLLRPEPASNEPANQHALWANPDADLPSLLHSAAALAQATGGSLKVVPGLTTLLTERVRRERGLPPAKARGFALNGKAAANLLSENGNPGGKPPLLETPEPAAESESPIHIVASGVDAGPVVAAGADQRRS
jgi:hypothetical protein